MGYKVMALPLEEKRLCTSNMVFLIQQTVGFLTNQLLHLHSLLLELDMTCGLETQEEISTARDTKVLLQIMTDGITTSKRWETSISLQRLTMLSELLEKRNWLILGILRVRF